MLAGLLPLGTPWVPEVTIINIAYVAIWVFLGILTIAHVTISVFLGILRGTKRFALTKKTDFKNSLLCSPAPLVAHPPFFVLCESTATFVPVNPFSSTTTTTKTTTTEGISATTSHSPLDATTRRATTTNGATTTTEGISATTSSALTTTRGTTTRPATTSNRTSSMRTFYPGSPSIASCKPRFV